MDSIVHGVTKSQTPLSDFHFSLSKDTQVVLVVKNPSANAGDVGDRSAPWVEKIPWRRKWQPTPVFSPIKSPRQRSL